MTSSTNFPGPVKVQGRDVATFLRNEDGSIRALVDPAGNVVGTPVVIWQNHTAQSKSDADAAESAALYTLDLPANTLGPNSTLRITTLWTVPNSAATKRLRGRFGGNVLWNLDLTTHLTFQMIYLIRNRNSRASQIAQANSTTVYGPIGSVGVQAFTLDFSTAQQLTVTAQWPVAGAGANNITLESTIVEHLYGA